MKAILHIGDQKTGTKSIQVLLRDNGPSWAPHGVVSPRSTKGAHYDIGLGALVKQHGRPWQDTYANYHGIRHDDIEPFLRAGLARESSGMHTAVFSFEGLLWLDVDEVGALKSFLDEYFDEFEIAVFLRRQDRKAVSLYSTKLLLGRGDLDLLPADGDFDYASALDCWSAHFGRAAINVFTLEEAPDTARAFAGRFLGSLPLEFVGRQNTSLSGQAQQVLRAMRGELGESASRRAGSTPLRDAIAHELTNGAVALPSEDEARAFVARFAEGNRFISRAYGQGRPDLFDSDYSDYRSSDRAVAFSANDVARVALSAWRAASARDHTAT